MVYVFVGNGKGKTSAALGVALRMLLIKKQVVWISWFKSSKWKTSEMGLSKKFSKYIKMYWGGEGFFIRDGEVIGNNGKTVKKAKINDAFAYDLTTQENHLRAAKQTYLLAENILAQGKTDLLVLDEILQAENEGLLTDSEIKDLINKRGDTNIILTGHRCPESLLKEVDLVTEMKKIKHPYDKGLLAVKGLDF